MKIHVGSKNETKLQAVREAFEESSFFKGFEVFPQEVVVEEFGHPITIDQIVKGAMDRAEQAFIDGDYGIKRNLAGVTTSTHKVWRLERGRTWYLLLLAREHGSLSTWH